MRADDIERVAMGADLIVDGYAVTAERGTGLVRVLNLHRPCSSAVFDSRFRMLETTMDDVELGIVEDYLASDGKYLEGTVA